MLLQPALGVGLGSSGQGVGPKLGPAESSLPTELIKGLCHLTLGILCKDRAGLLLGEQGMLGGGPGTPRAEHSLGVSPGGDPRGTQSQDQSHQAGHSGLQGAS